MDASNNSGEQMQVARLMTSVIGMMAESGEFAEVVKKKIFQADTEFSNDEIFHMKRELGDVLWYWVQGCIALGFTPEEVMQENIKKLEKPTPTALRLLGVRCASKEIYNGKSRLF